MLWDTVDNEEWMKQVALAEHRVQAAAGATSGRIGDPTEFRRALIKWARAHDMDEDADLIQEGIAQ